MPPVGPIPPQNIRNERMKEYNDVMDIIRVVSGKSPVFKLTHWSRYSENACSPEFQDIKLAIDVYKKEVIMKKK